MISMDTRTTGRVCALACGLMVVLVGCGKREAPHTEAQESAAPAARETVAETLVQDERRLARAPATPTNVRPVRVTVLEYGSPAADAEVWIEHFAPTSSWWHARTRSDGRATLLVPIQYTWFRVSASKAPNAIVSHFARDLPPRAEPLEVTLHMTNQGVIITVLLQAARRELFSNATVRIRPYDNRDWDYVSIARVPNTSEPRVALPPIRRGLKGLRVEVMSPRCATSYSKPFDTLDGRDKTITVKLLEGVRVYGTARMVDGSAAGAFTLFGTPAGTHRLARGAGVVRATLATDATGAYECTRFVPDFYRLQITRNDAQTMHTNMLVGDDGAQLDLVFAPQEVIPVRGRVLFERTQQPAPDVIVRLRSTREHVATTDVAGTFVMRVPCEHGMQGVLQISHAGYADVSRYLNEQYHGEELTLVLRDAAQITGTIRYDDGTPASGVFVNIRTYTDWRAGARKRRVALGGGEPSWQQPLYYYHAVAASDAAGVYVISNVAAPETYTFTVNGASARVLQPEEDTPGVKTQPGETAHCDLVVQRTPRVLLKVCTPQGNVVRSYDASVEYFTSEHGAAWSTRSSVRAQPDADGWQTLPNWGWRGDHTRVSISVRTRDGATAQTNDLSIPNTGTQYITLTATANASRGLCGYVYDANEEPMVDVNISAEFGTYGRAIHPVKTDQLGFFELPGSGAPTNIMVQLRAWHGRWWFFTNVPEQASPLIWVLDTSRVISGRVCLERAGQPATNFAVGVGLDSAEPFHAADGRFALQVHNWYPTTGMVYARVGEYAPVGTPYVLPAHGGVDVGDIVVVPLAGTVRGRVVDEQGTPVAASVTLVVAGSDHNVPPAMTDEHDGWYEFTRLPSGAYYIVAYKPGAATSARTEAFSLAAGQTYTAPDLVLSMTNAARVRLVFVKADGTPAAFLQVSHLQRRTDSNGAVEEFVHLGRHENWTLFDDRGGAYYAEAFDVTPATRELRIALAPSELIEGTVTIDGAPMPDGFIYLSGVRTRRNFGAYVKNGAFSCRAEPGPYLATSMEQGQITSAELVAGSNNTIAFVSGDASLTATLPMAGHWYGVLATDINGQTIRVAFKEIQNDSTLEFSQLHAGAYQLTVIGEVGAARTNLQREVQISRGQRASVRF